MITELEGYRKGGLKRADKNRGKINVYVKQAQDKQSKKVYSDHGRRYI